MAVPAGLCYENAMSRSEKISVFCASVADSLSAGDFLKLSLGHYKGAEGQLKKILIKKILIKRADMVSFTYRYETRDIVKNYAPEEGVRRVEGFLNTGFQSATLFTTGFDLVYEENKGKVSLKKTDVQGRAAVSLEHDRAKNRLIVPEGKTYLHDLKITDEAGAVYKGAQDKYRQINKYVEILSTLVKNIPVDKTLKIADMGSGKGYLTFALYDYLTDVLKVKADVTGVEYRPDLVALCNDVATRAKFDGLKFVQGSIEDYEAKALDILIALHACDMATDDAIAKGIKAQADLIVVAPCCHKQIRQEMEAHKARGELDFVTKHGIFLERQAEMVTDSIRALILEYFGYSTKVFEFISDAHTAKNVMIVGTRTAKAGIHDEKIKARIQEAKDFFGIQHHHLEKMMGLSAQR